MKIENYGVFIFLKKEEALGKSRKSRKMVIKAEQWQTVEDGDKMSPLKSNSKHLVSDEAHQR